MRKTIFVLTSYSLSFFLALECNEKRNMSNVEEELPSSGSGSGGDGDHDGNNYLNNNVSAATTTATDTNGITDGDDVAINNKATTRDDRLMQSVFDKSTTTTSASSPSTVMIDEEKVKKAISFLRNTEIQDISPSEKRKYLTSVGMTQDEIDTALDRMALAKPVESRSSPQQQQPHNHYGPHRSPGMPHMSQNNHYLTNNNHNMGGNNYREDWEGDKSNNFSFSSWVGGFCMSTFCLAALRWLNGGDFVLIPPPMAGNNRMNAVGRIKLKSNDDTQHNNDDNTDDGEESNELNYLQDDNDDASYGDPGLKMILNDGSADHEALHGNNNQKDSSSFEDLVMEVKSLSLAITSFREEQDRANRVTAAQLGKGVTDDAMDFLRQQKPVLLKKSGETAVDKNLARIISLITEMVHELTQLKDSFSDEKIVVEESSTTIQTDVSRKINIALEKGKEVLALIQNADETGTRSIKNIDSEQVTPLTEHRSDSDNGSEHTEPGDDQQVDSGIIEQEAVSSSSVGDNADGDTSDVDDKSEDLEKALQVLSSQNKAEELKVGANMLYLYCKNLSKNPTVPRYRKIYTNNNSFKSKVGKLVGASDFLFALGFVERSNFFEWSPPNETSSDTKSQLDFALVALELLQKGTRPGVGDNERDTSEKSEVE